MDLSYFLHCGLHRLLKVARLVRLGAAEPTISDLGVVGDRRTAAIITRSGEIVWYCPGRFDAPSILACLLDPAIGGSWRVDLPGAIPGSRRYLDDSAILETTLHHPSGFLTITDWMSLPGEDLPRGLLCRMFSAAPAELRLKLAPRPDYGQRLPRLRRATEYSAVVDHRFYLQASHPVRVCGSSIEMRVAHGESSWAVLSDIAAASVVASKERLANSLAATRKGWHQIANYSSYTGPYAKQVRASMRAVRLLIHEDTGAIVAAPTSSLPEVSGGRRNYDYRYTWLRDSGLIVRALTRFDPEGIDARQLLGFVAGLCGTGYHKLLDPVFAVGGEPVPDQVRLGLAGYHGSRPTWAGNRAGRQLQLGSLANFLLAACEFYQQVEPGVHWEVVSEVADFLIQNWRRRDNGIWEQRRRRHFTSSKVFIVCALEGMAPYARNAEQANRYREIAREIRTYVSQSCHMQSGAYAAAAGMATVDISAALFPTFGYTAADDPAMDLTMRELDQHYCVAGHLYHRHLENAVAARHEGAFLAGTFWIAHYWLARGDLRRSQRLIDAGLSHANDLGLFAEEVDSKTGTALGNYPLGLVHASFLSAVADYHAATA